MTDLIVNHMSADSEQCRSWLADQEKSPYDVMFVTYPSVYPDGADEAAGVNLVRLDALYRRSRCHCQTCSWHP